MCINVKHRLNKESATLVEINVSEFLMKLNVSFSLFRVNSRLFHIDCGELIDNSLKIIGKTFDVLRSLNISNLINLKDLELE